MSNKEKFKKWLKDHEKDLTNAVYYVGGCAVTWSAMLMWHKWKKYTFNVGFDKAHKNNLVTLMDGKGNVVPTIGEWIEILKTMKRTL